MGRGWRRGDDRHSRARGLRDLTCLLARREDLGLASLDGTAKLWDTETGGLRRVVEDRGVVTYGSVRSRLSLVLFLAAAAVWVRGHFAGDRFFRYRVVERDGVARTVSDTCFCWRGIVAYARSTMSSAPRDLHAQLRDMERRAPGGRMPRHITVPPTSFAFDLHD